MAVAGTSELILTARVARGYYVQDKSKSDLAIELGISRFRVARLLEAARREGIVQIEIVTPGTVNTELSAQLQERFDLKHAVVLDVSDEDPSALRARLGEAAAEVLSDIATAQDVIGLGWARSLRGIGDAIGRIPPCPAIQLTGALTGPDGSDVLELVRKVANAGGGTAHVFYAPIIASDAATARTLRRQPDVMSALKLIPQVTIGVVGIGAWTAGQSTIFDMSEPAARDRAYALGTRADLSGALIDGAGHPVHCALSQRIIGVSATQLSEMDTVLAVAYGAGKAEAVRSALTGGLVNALVTHSRLARIVLADAETAAPRRR